MKTAAAVADILKREGTEYFFCFPVNALIDECAGVGIRPIVARTERTLLNMADALPQGGDVEAGLAKMRAKLQPPAAARAPRWMPWALGLQGAAVAMLLGLWLQARDDGPVYQGLSAPAESAPVAADALVMFKPGTSEQALRELLQAQGASVVAGPTETGAWLLRVEARGLVALRASPLVALAEPLQPGPAR